MLDILGKDRNFLSFSEFKKKYNIKRNFLYYLGLCNAIPKHWRKVFDRDFEKESACMRKSTLAKNDYLMTCKIIVMYVLTVIGLLYVRYSSTNDIYISK